MGAGTTAAVAHKLGRRWIAVERSEATFSTFTLPRLSKVVAGVDGGGVTTPAQWQGGGSFCVVDVARSMFESVNGVVVLADWATGGDLAEATAAQLGFAYTSGMPPFCGVKGRRRLAVIDGRVNAAVVELLATLIADNETMLVCGTSIDPDAREKLPRGSNLQKIPASIIDQYRRMYRNRRSYELRIEEDYTMRDVVAGND